MMELERLGEQRQRLKRRGYWEREGNEAQISKGYESLRGIQSGVETLTGN
jgi:hypothetical protein